MSSLWKRSMIWLGLEDEAAEEATGVTEPEMPMQSGVVEAQSVAMPPQADLQPDRPSIFNGGGGTVRTIQATDYSESEGGVRTIPASSEPVYVVESTGFNDAQKIGERFRSGQPVIINLQQVERDTARRIVDFASGLTFALRGSMQKVGEHVFLVTPANVEVSPDEMERLRQRGLMGR